MVYPSRQVVHLGQWWDSPHNRGAPPRAHYAECPNTFALSVPPYYIGKLVSLADLSPPRWILAGVEGRAYAKLWSRDPRLKEVSSVRSHHPEPPSGDLPS